MTTPREVTLRSVEPPDLDRFFEFQRDPEANRMAAFAAADPADRAAFDARWRRILANLEVIVRTIEADGEVVGSVLLWRDPELDGPEVSYWIGREHWGRGIATRALEAFLGVVAQRPLFGRAAADNAGSLRVLEKAGFVRVGAGRGFANARGEEIDELILRLDAGP